MKKKEKKDNNIAYFSGFPPTVLNPNACILGGTRSGRSAAAMHAISDILENTEDEVCIVSSSLEYESAAGISVSLSDRSENRINPFDLWIFDQESVEEKMQFLTAFIEILIGDRPSGLSNMEKLIISDVMQDIYAGFTGYFTSALYQRAESEMPTLHDLYKVLAFHPRPEAHEMAKALEKYMLKKNGADLFSCHTNISDESRCTAYNISGSNYKIRKALCLLAFGRAWNKGVENLKKCEKNRLSCKRRTWIFIDDFSYLLSGKQTVHYIHNAWIHSRKNGLKLCAVTDDIKDMTADDDSQSIINDSGTYLLFAPGSMYEAKHDGDIFSMLGITSKEQSWLYSGCGHGFFWQPENGIRTLTDEKEIGSQISSKIQISTESDAD